MNGQNGCRFTEEDDVLVVVQFSQVGGQRSVGKVDRAGNRADLEFVGFADINQLHRLVCREQGIQLMGQDLIELLSRLSVINPRHSTEFRIVISSTSSV